MRITPNDVHLEDSYTSVFPVPVDPYHYYPSVILFNGSSIFLALKKKIKYNCKAL